MRERLEAKMGNCNNNGFKFRKLFQMFDKNKTGQVG
jgi:Ca2+-binding EF-hand superfamily protein